MNTIHQNYISPLVDIIRKDTNEWNNREAIIAGIFSSCAFAICLMIGYLIGHFLHDCVNFFKNRLLVN